MTPSPGRTSLPARACCDNRWKLVYYLGEPDGDLYDMVEDPGERRNLWAHPGHHDRREQMVKELLEWSLRSAIASRQTETPRPQQPMHI